MAYLALVHGPDEHIAVLAHRQIIAARRPLHLDELFVFVVLPECALVEIALTKKGNILDEMFFDLRISYLAFGYQPCNSDEVSEYNI